MKWLLAIGLIIFGIVSLVFLIINGGAIGEIGLVPALVIGYGYAWLGRKYVCHYLPEALTQKENPNR